MIKSISGGILMPSFPGPRLPDRLDDILLPYALACRVEIIMQVSKRIMLPKEALMGNMAHGTIFGDRLLTIMIPAG